MIRDIGKKVKVMKYTEVEETVTKEKIISITQLPDEKTVIVDKSLLNLIGEVIQKQTIFIKDDNYDLLYGLSEMFEEGKTTGCFREEDLWIMIDKIEEYLNQTA